ncbi:MAG TPA: TonB family protein [Pyrinomonadaceae bacterium]|nr:TonB family protein [Pyrinomonadaceae bacterium]
MMKQISFVIAIILSCAVVLQAQNPDDAPFAVMDKEVKHAPLRWAGDKESLSKIFDDERKRLGPQFETELLKWLGNDPTKHYWVSAFIECESYLHGNKRLPELSLLIKEQGLLLVRDKKDNESLGYVVGLSVTAAVLSDELGLASLAISHKSEAERLLLRDPLLGGHVPAMSETEWQRYDAIKSPVNRKTASVSGRSSPAVANRASTSPLQAPITGGVVNGRALRLPKPEYPRSARDAGASGTVEVEVLIDETGRVISARAISGHPELRKTSEDAASRAEFSPTKIAGQPVKVTGTILYNFVYR